MPNFQSLCLKQRHAAVPELDVVVPAPYMIARACFKLGICGGRSSVGQSIGLWYRGSWVRAPSGPPNLKMFYFYVLKLSNDTYYYGSTSDLKDRLSRHQSGRSKYTQKYLPLELIYYEAYKTKNQAITREKQVKASSSIRKSIINRSAGQSTPLITGRSVVQVDLGPPSIRCDLGRYR